MEGPEPRGGTVEYRAIRCGTGIDHVPTCMYSTGFLVQHPPRPGPARPSDPDLTQCRTPNTWPFLLCHGTGIAHPE